MAFWAAAVPAAIAGAAGILGGSQANRAQRAEARRNRRFQERMRNTAWQAAVADMTAAGINPAVAYSKGPAAAPSGNMAAQGNFLGSSVSNAMQAARVNKELRLLDRQIEQVSAAAQKTQEEKIYQQRMNRALGTFIPGPGGRMVFSPGPIWNKLVADANIAGFTSNIKKSESVMADNLRSIAGTQAGKYASWVQYLLRNLTGGK